MRATCEIIADLKDNKEVPYEELKMACLVQSSLLSFFQQDTKFLLKGGIVEELVRTMYYKDENMSSLEDGIPSWYWNGIKADPYKWLSEKDLTRSEEWKKWHSIGTQILTNFGFGEGKQMEFKKKDMSTTEIRKINYENCPRKCSDCSEACESVTVRDCREHLSKIFD